MGVLRTDIISHSQLESAGGSVEFDGSGDYLTIPYGSGVFHFTEDYTIDFYIKFTTNSGTQRVFGQRLSNASDISVLGEFASNNFLLLLFSKWIYHRVSYYWKLWNKYRIKYLASCRNRE